MHGPPAFAATRTRQPGNRAIKPKRKTLHQNTNAKTTIATTTKTTIATTNHQNTTATGPRRVHLPQGGRQAWARRARGARGDLGRRPAQSGHDAAVGGAPRRRRRRAVRWPGGGAFACVCAWGGGFLASAAAGSRHCSPHHNKQKRPIIPSLPKHKTKNHAQPSQTLIDVSGEVPADAVAALLAACRSGVFSRVQQQVCND